MPSHKRNLRSVLKNVYDLGRLKRRHLSVITEDQKHFLGKVYLVDPRHQ